MIFCAALIAESISEQQLTLAQFLTTTLTILTILAGVVVYFFKTIGSVREAINKNAEELRKDSAARFEEQEDRIAKVETQMAIIFKLDEQRTTTDADIQKKLETIIDNIGKLSLGLVRVQERLKIMDENGNRPENGHYIAPKR